MKSASSNPQAYDIDAIQDKGIRIQYQTLNKRFRSLADQITSIYKLDGKRIDVIFAVNGNFNASVEMHKDRYLIQISNAVPVLLMIFFDKILSNPKNLPWLSSDGTGEVGYEIPFSIRANDLMFTKKWLVKTNKIRAFASYILADIATSFMFLHELGHILGGHLKDLEIRGDEAFHAEFEMLESTSTDDFWVRHLREYQADSVGAYLVTHIIEELVEDVKVNERTQAVFGPSQIAIENTISLTIAAIYGLFAYARGQEMKLKLHSSHPDPLVRAFYIRDFVFQIMRNKCSFDLELSQDMLQARFDEMNDMLSILGISDPVSIGEDNMEKARNQSHALKNLQYEHGKVVSRFAFIDWTD